MSLSKRASLSFEEHDGFLVLGEKEERAALLGATDITPLKKVLEENDLLFAASRKDGRYPGERKSKAFYKTDVREPGEPVPLKRKKAGVLQRTRKKRQIFLPGGDLAKRWRFPACPW